MSFREFFQTVHGRSPFPWQEEAARRLIAGDRLESVTVPTGCGKTALIDAALYHAAHGGPRRIFFIINRRVVVDEAYSRAERIRNALLEGTTPLMRELAQRMDELQVVRLRGGVQMDEDWVLRPEAISIVVSTVDQVGSRLLHRGYGVSSRMWSLHAGFVGNHALYLVDEAHLSHPFVATVRSAVDHGADIRLVELSATLGRSSEGALGLSEEDRCTPIIEMRLKARKQASLEVAPENDAQFAVAAGGRAEALAGLGSVIGVVVNRVRTARLVWKQLREKGGHDAHLLIGRVRPHDRDHLLKELMPRIRAGRKRRDGKPLFVVATQTIEVGADLDFDGLVTEAAPLSALRQRFGRVDRLGERGESKAVILGREKQLSEEGAATAPVYGADLRDAWQWLVERAGENGGLVDFGLLAMTQAMKKSPPPQERPDHAPALLPTHIDLFTQTGPDAPQLDPAPWLHGPQRPGSEVSVIWRGDLDPAHSSEVWEERVRSMPPLTAEALSLPIGALRDLLQGKGRFDAGDVEGGEEGRSVGDTVRRFVRWRGPDECEAMDRLAVRAGDTVVLPRSYGGCDRYGWAPGSEEPVTDIAEACLAGAERPFALRLIPRLWLVGGEDKPLHSLALMPEVATLRSLIDHPDPEEGVDEGAMETLWQVIKETVENMDHRYAELLGTEFDYTLLKKEGIVLSRKRLEEIGGSTSTGVEVGLAPHLTGVATMAEALSSGNPYSCKVVQAARSHDLGKQAPPFQAMLYGDPFRASSGPLLAKSGLTGRKAREAARNWLPKGFRHELYSVELAGTAEPLVNHLIGAHHGYGRPWFPPCADPQAPGARSVELIANWAAQFARIRGEVGPWRLAELELLIRAADIRRSQDERVASIGDV